MTAGLDFSIVVPTVGRASLTALLETIAGADGPRPAQIVVVDDRPGAPAPLDVAVEGWPAYVFTVVRSGGLGGGGLGGGGLGGGGLGGGGRGPAAARNAGWRVCSTPWIAFLDDDVLVTASWLADLRSDLAAAAADVGGVQGRITVPLPAHRRPTDWERNTAGLQTASWITADLAYRTDALAEVDGFDERFPRAFREDADLALRVQARGWRLEVGTRTTVHPVRPTGWATSVRQQRGNADDALMRRLHGADWYERARESRGRRRTHLLTTVAGLAAAAGVLTGRRAVAAAGAGVWAALSADFARVRIAPGPRDAAEVARMIATSVAIPPVAVRHWAAGTLRHRSAPPWAAIAGRACAPLPARLPDERGRVDALLLDRDGTLIHDVPYNGNPDLVRPIDGVAEALHRLRAAGMRIGVVSNQSGVARGLITPQAVAAVNARVENLLGPFDTWQVCPHEDADRCACRKPQPGLLTAAAGDLGVPPERCVMVGDTVADLQAGRAAGVALAVLVPTAATLPGEIAAAPWRAPTLTAVADLVLRAVAAVPG